MSAEENSGNGANRRIYDRASYPLLILYRYNSLDEFFSEYSADLSAGGIFLHNDTPPPLGTIVYLQFVLKDGATFIEGEGRVVRVAPPESSAVPGMAVEFTKLEEQSKKVLAELVQRQKDLGGE